MRCATERPVAALHEAPKLLTFIRRKVDPFSVRSWRTPRSHRNANVDRSRTKFTELQGQHLAFIYCYTVLNRRPPSEADFQAFFGVTPPTVHRMVGELERRGLIRRTPRQARRSTRAWPQRMPLACYLNRSSPLCRGTTASGRIASRSSRSRRLSAALKEWAKCRVNDIALPIRISAR